MDYIDAATTGTLSPHILPIMDLKKMLSHIEETLLSTLHLPVSSEDILHFYCYLLTHVLIANMQFLLFINVPIQDWSQQLSIYKMFTLDIPHGNFTAHYDISTKYLGITQDETIDSGNLTTTIQDLPRSKWTVLYHSYTNSTTCKPTILHYHYICQEYNQHFSQMFLRDQEIFRCQYQYLNLLQMFGY